MLGNINVEEQKFTSTIDLEAALARGSSFENLFIPYKYVTDKILKGKNTRQNILAMIDMYSFFILDLTYFQITHQDDKEINRLLKIAKIELKQLKEYYDTNFSPLSIDCISDAKITVGPWPWEDRF